MIICGLKLTHDGAVALLDENKLVFSVEIEKLNNNRRYSCMKDTSLFIDILSSFGYKISDVHSWVIDGWLGNTRGNTQLIDNGVVHELSLGPYHEGSNDILKMYTGEFLVRGKPTLYTSYSHTTGHLMSAYCTSPFAVRQEPSFVLIWDGGMFPRLYYVDTKTGTIENYGELFFLIGHVYATAAHHFGPFRRNKQSNTADCLSVAGKLMAYIALGSPRDEIIILLKEIYVQQFESDLPFAVNFRHTVGGWGTPTEPSMEYLHAYFEKIKELLNSRYHKISEEDVLASVHRFLEELLVQRLSKKIQACKGDGPWNLCFAGGCALNIKWNSAIRASALFHEVWVPPFPNDSGSALGAATAHLVNQKDLIALEWSHRSGPTLNKTLILHEGWTSSKCTPQELAQILWKSNSPVVILNGRAELGPRALGGRSIIAPATDKAMKELLNRIKRRENYRPIAPICLVDFAPGVFNPGTPDPYMLFDHTVREEWVDRIPAILHLDGSARLQTVSSENDSVLYSVLQEYHKLSGIPVLCNTSANYNGCGFFPDVGSAMEWGEIDLIWSEDVLYRRT